MKLFVDFDDTIVNSSEEVIKILNKRYGLDKSIRDLHDWKYHSIYKDIKQKEICSIYDSNEFWNHIKVYDGFNKVAELNEIAVCSCGDTENLIKKKKFINSNFKDFSTYFLNTELGYTGRNKNLFDMSNSIQVDDVFENLFYTNASLKILFKNFNNFTWQEVVPMENLYVVNTWEEIYDIVRWFNGNNS